MYEHLRYGQSANGATRSRTGTRALVVPRTPYIVPYRVQRTLMQILRVFHGTRRWSDQL